MKYTLPEKIRRLEPYQPITGEYQIRLDANESYLNLSPKQLQAVEKRLSEIAYNRYPDPYAGRLCQKFADYYGIKADLVTVGNGSDELIALLCGAFFGPTDKMGVFSHDFSMYRIDCEIYGVPCLEIPKEEDLTISVDRAIEFIRENDITVLIFSNPCNPTSLGLCREEVLRLISGVDALVVLDEAYMDFWNQSLLDVVEDYENLLIMRTCSKAIGLAGIRCGFAVANPTLTRALKAAKAPYNVNTVSQIYGEEILGDTAYLQQATKEIIHNREILNQALKKLAGTYPLLEQVYLSSTNFVYLKTNRAKEIFERLLSRSIAIRQMGTYLRISTGNETENQILIKELEEILTELTGKR